MEFQDMAHMPDPAAEGAEGAERVGEFYLSADDRRRLAVSETLMLLERDGFVTQGAAGQVILNNALGMDDVLPLADATNKRLAQILTRGY